MSKFLGVAKDELTLHQIEQAQAGLTASKIAFTRDRLKAAITDANQMLSVQAVSIWEYAHLITVKPVPANPDTWDWYPAVKAAMEYSAAWGVEVDGYNQLCNIGTEIIITAGQVRMKNATIKALPSITATMIKLDGATKNPQFTQVVFDGSFSAYSWMEVKNTDDAVFNGCTFKTLGNDQPNVFGLWIRNSRRAIVVACNFSYITSADFTRAIYFDSDCRGAIISSNTFSNITSAGDDGDAIVCEMFDNDDQAFIVDGNYFENVQKRLVKAGGNGWVITNNRAKTKASGGLYSVFSLYGSDMVLSGNNVEITTGIVSYPIDVGGQPGSMPNVRNIVISDNVFRMTAVASPDVQDFIRQSNIIENLRVHNNYVDYCRTFFNNPLNFTLNNAHFWNNTSEFCYGNDFYLGDTSTVGSDVIISGHTSLMSVTGFALIQGGAGGSFVGLSANNNNYKKSFGLCSSGNRFTAATGNINNGAIDISSIFDNGTWVRKLSAAPASGSHLVGDLTIRTPAVSGASYGFLCTAAGSPGTHIPWGPTQIQSVYTASNVSNTRSFDTATVTLAILANVVGTLIADFKSNGNLK